MLVHSGAMPRLNAVMKAVDSALRAARDAAGTAFAKALLSAHENYRFTEIAPCSVVA